jgi:RHS repeat-associated protein
VDFGLGWDESGARNYDPQLGRFLAVDPLADQEDQESWTPYHYGFNNPARYNDPDGRVPPLIAAAVQQAVKGAVIGAVIDYGFQVAENLVQGKSVGESLTDIDGARLGQAAAVGAVTGGFAKVVPGVVRLVSVAKKADDLAKRAKDIQNAQANKVARDKSTTAVAKVVTREGKPNNVVASSRNRLTPAQRKELKKGEAEVKGKGHAEATIVDNAVKNGEQLTEIAASRPICNDCLKKITDNFPNATILTPVKPPIKISQ